MEQKRTTPERITELQLTNEEISPLFLAAHDVDNIVLPEGW